VETMGTVRETLLDAWSGRRRSQRWQSPKSYGLASRPQVEHPLGFERCLPGWGLRLVRTEPQECGGQYSPRRTLLRLSLDPPFEYWLVRGASTKKAS
jgi:hypothetical protein